MHGAQIPPQSVSSSSWFFIWSSQVSWISFIISQARFCSGMMLCGQLLRLLKGETSMSLHFLDWTSSTQSDHTEHSQSSLQMYPPAPPAPPPDEDDWLLGEEMAFTVSVTLFDWVVFDPS